jgi:hypothetical protein
MIKDLSYVVNRVKLDKGITSTQYDMQIRQFALDGLLELKQMGLISSAFKSVKLPVENRVADFNHLDDYESYIKIGTIINNKLVTYNLNENIIIDNTISCCEVPKTDETLFFPLWSNVGYSTPYYGTGSEVYKGGYKVDSYNKKILFDFDPEYVIMEYTGGVDNAYLLEGQELALRYYVFWKLSQFSRNDMEKREAILFQREYASKVKGLHRATRSLKAYEIVDIFLNSFRQVK